MSTQNAKTTSTTGTIAKNRKVLHEYFIEQRFEAGLMLQGWEVKSLRAGRGDLTDSYVHIRKGEAYLLNAKINPLLSASTHISPEASRTRKLLLHKEELNKLIGNVERKGYTLVPLTMYWKGSRVKVEIALAKGKKQHDKREAERDRDWQKEKARVISVMSKKG